MDGAEGEDKMVAMSDFMDILEDTLEKFLDDEAEVSYEDDDEAAELEEPVDDDLDLDAGAMDPSIDEVPEEEEEVPGNTMYENQEQIVAEVAKRVAARLEGNKKKEQMVDQLAERIMNRLIK